MKKMISAFALLALLTACHHEGEVASEDVVVDEPVVEVEAAEDAEESALDFEISVDSIANGATVTTFPVVISGKVSEEATAVSVNGWELQSYEAGSSEWKYVAKPEFKNLQEGENTYEIKATGEGDLSAEMTLKINFVSGS